MGSHPSGPTDEDRGSERVPDIIADKPMLAALWSYWRSKCKGGAMPRRSDIDPTEIPRLLPHLQLVERTYGGRFRYRLTGTAIVEAYGFELTGQFVDEVIPIPRREIAERHYMAVFATGNPIFVRNRYTTPRSIELVVSRIILPLTNDGTNVSVLLMGQVFDFAWALSAQLGDNSTIDLESDQVVPL